MVAAICAAAVGLSDENARKVQPILLDLADAAGTTTTEVNRAGRYLRSILNPDGTEKEARADYDGRYLLVRETATGGMEGEFRLPIEAAARLRAILDAHAKPR